MNGSFNEHWKERWKGRNISLDPKRGWNIIDKRDKRKVKAETDIHKVE